jgi:hypothetical protein
MTTRDNVAEGKVGVLEIDRISACSDADTITHIMNRHHRFTGFAYIPGTFSADSP